jgi:hypothetical protein
VEPVMGFCTPKEHEISPRVSRSSRPCSWKAVQPGQAPARHLRGGAGEPARWPATVALKGLKSSLLDGAAKGKRRDYSKARDEMLKRTSVATWLPGPSCARPQESPLAIISHLVQTLRPKKIAHDRPRPGCAVPSRWPRSRAADTRDAMEEARWGDWAEGLAPCLGCMTYGSPEWRSCAGYGAVPFFQAVIEVDHLLRQRQRYLIGARRRSPAAGCASSLVAIEIVVATRSTGRWARANEKASRVDHGPDHAVLTRPAWTTRPLPDPSFT